MPYYLDLYRRISVRSLDDLTHHRKPMCIRSERVATLAEAKAVFEDMAGYLPDWLASLNDPAEYLGVEEELLECDGTYSEWGLSIEGAEKFPNSRTFEAIEKGKEK